MGTRRYQFALSLSGKGPALLMEISKDASTLYLCMRPRFLVVDPWLVAQMSH